MTAYRPKPGDKVMLTVRATVDVVGNYRIDHRTEVGLRNGETMPVDDTYWVWPTMACLVRVEPAPVELPTGFGARIRATVTLDGEATPDVLLVHCPANWPGTDLYPWSAARSVRDRRWFASESLSDVVVLDAGEQS